MGWLKVIQKCSFTALGGQISKIEVWGGFVLLGALSENLFRAFLLASSSSCQKSLVVHGFW